MNEYLPRPEDLLVLMPGAAAGILLFLAAGRFQRRGNAAAAVILAGTAPGAAHLITYLRILGMPPFPPVQATERMAFAVLGFTLGGMLADLFSFRTWIRGMMVCGMAAGLVFYLLEPFLELPVGAEYRVAASSAVFLVTGITIFWIMLAGLARSAPGPELPLTLSLALGLGGQIFLMYGAASLAQLAGTAGLYLGAAAVLYRWLPDAGLPSAAAVALTGVAAGTGLDGYYFISDTPPASSLILLAASPLPLLISRIPKLRDMKPVPRFVLRMALVLVPLVSALWIALDHLPRAADDPYGGF